MAITVKELEALSKRPGKWLSERVRYGHGVLAFRALASGEISIYFRYKNEGRRPVINLGHFGPDGTRGRITLIEARTKAGEYARRHADETVALRELLEAETRERDESLRTVRVGTFDELLTTYCATLRAEGKESASQAAALFHKWVREPFPELLLLKAGNITHSEIMEILKGAVAAKKTRTVNKLRSYLLSAFNRAIIANGDPSLAVEIGSASTKYGIKGNPVAATRRVSKFERKNIGKKLSAREIQLIWSGLDDYPLEIKIFVRLNFRLAGQRIAQLLRLKGSDVNLVNGTLCLWDSKGRRENPRKHELPIPSQAIGLIKELLAVRGDGYLFSKDGNKSINPSLISVVIKEIRNQDKNGDKITDLSPEDFCARDLRTTAESRLSEMGFSRENRGRLLSHGIGGVQDQHYDQAVYLPLLNQMLHQWNGWLDTVLEMDTYEGTNVLPFRAKTIA